MNHYFLGKSVLLITIWGLMVASILLILVSSVIFFSYKKMGKKLNTKIVVQLATFLAIYIVIAFISNIFGEIHIIFNYIVPATVGFIFGPVLGILFGFTSTIVENIVYGGNFGILNLLFNPLLGLISGVVGLVYLNLKINNDEETEKNGYKNISLLFHLTILIILFITIVTGVLAIINSEHFDKVQTFLIFSILNIISIELFYLYIVKYSKNEVDELLFTLIVIAISIARLWDLTITPFRGYFIGKYEIYWISLLDYTFRSGYMIILQSFGAYQMIRVTMDVIN